MSDQQKTPQPGEWWETRDGQRRYIAAVVPAEISDEPVVAFDQLGSVSVYLIDGFWMLSRYPCRLDLTRHLPGCTGWDWEEKNDG